MSALAEDGKRARPVAPHWPFFAQEYLRIMRGRLALLIWVLLVCSVAAVPFLMAKPAPEVLSTLAAWLGPEQAGAKLILFTWVDATMNKLVVILGPVLAGGIIAEERARGTLDLLTAKPIGAGDYFTAKLAATAAAFATFYVVAVVGAIVTFPWRVAGFNAIDLAALSVVHLFAGVFAVTFSAAMAVSFERKLTGMLVSVAVIGSLAGLAFLGLIYPAYRTVSYFNPFFHGIVLIASIDRYGVGDVLHPIVWLLGFNLAAAWVGRRRAVRILEHG